jgi:hypothetical protein
MNNKVLTALPIAAALYLSAASPVAANAIPDFGSCVNPQWTQTQVNYSGKHGVIGVDSFNGTDTIYTSGGNVLQCLCTDQGQGYQTNWLKASDISNGDIDNLKAQGWIYISDGRDWGLEEAPYLAKNSNYECVACTPTPTAGPTPTPGPEATPTPQTRVDSASANNTSSNSLASTGSALLIALSLLAGVVSLILGMTLRKFSK